MNRELIKKLIKWYAILFIFHIAAWFIFGLISGNIGSMYETHKENANATIFMYSTVCTFIIAVLLTRGDASYASYTRDLRNAMREDGFTFFGYYRKTYLSEHILKVVIFAVFQLPFTVFFAVWGFMLNAPTIFEKFYILDAGAYVFTDSAILGLLINTAIFAVCYIGSSLLLLRISMNDAVDVM